MSLKYIASKKYSRQVQSIYRVTTSEGAHYFIGAPEVHNPALYVTLFKCFCGNCWRFLVLYTLSYGGDKI